MFAGASNGWRLMENDGADESRTSRWVARWTGYGIAAAVLAYFSAGEMAAADPIPLASAGLFLALAIIVDHHANTTEPSRWTIVMMVASVLLFCGGAGIVNYVASQAEQSIHANQARCLAIQRDMLSAHPRRSDSPDLFQALGCRPQGNGGVAAPPTDLEKRAGHPLPWGGYPPPP